MTLSIDFQFSLASAPAPVIKPSYPLWRVMHDNEIFAKRVTFAGHGQLYHSEGWDWRAGYPEIYWMYGGHSIELTKELQQLTYAINLGIAPLKWRDVYTDWIFMVAGASKTGFSHKPTPGYTYVPKPDHINSIDLDAEIKPYIDTQRAFGGSILSGYEDGNFVIFDALHPDNLPSAEWLLARPWLTMHAVSITKAGGLPKIEKFPQNGVNRTLIPLVANAPVRLPRVMLVPVEHGTFDWNTEPYKVW